jgi:hypothetical protein
LVWRPSGPNGPFINPDLPNCQDSDSAYVKLKKQGGDWVVDYKCEEIETSPEHLYARHRWGQWFQNSYKKALGYFATTNRSWTPAITDPTASGIWWWWDVIWSDAFWPAKWIGVFQILRPWIYALSFSAYIEAWYLTSNVVNSIRCWLYQSQVLDQWNVWDFYELWDFKFEWCNWTEYWWWLSWQFNRMHPQNWDAAQFYKNWWTGVATNLSWFPFARTYILNVWVPIEVGFRVWVDMRYIDVRWIDPDPELFNIHISSASEYHETSNSAACRIDCTRLWDAVVGSRYHVIS